MSPLGFVRKYTGKYLTAPGGLGGQCVDLVNQYLVEARGASPVRLNAVDWAKASVPGYKWVPNMPTNYPKLGSFVVWGPFPQLGIGQYGHIAIALVADAMEMVTFDQDWPYGYPCTLWVHSYGGVLGWQAPA